LPVFVDLLLVADDLKSDIKEAFDECVAQYKNFALKCSLPFLKNKKERREDKTRKDKKRTAQQDKTNQRNIS